MKELRRKTNLTILILLSVILTAAIVMVNVRSYVREQEGVRRNLNILEDRDGLRGNKILQNRGAAESIQGRDAQKDIQGREPADVKPERGMRPKDLENMMVMDYELYTVELDGRKISGVFSHGNESEDFDAEAAATEIIAQEGGDALKVGNLYFSDYSYRYRFQDSIVILNDREIRSRLWELLIQSMLLFGLLELVIIFVSRRITGWIVKPAEDAFIRQKEFIADASHELKTPLAVIMASADEIPVRDENQKNLENIRYESDRMSRLISGLLNLSRLENGTDAAEHKEEDLSMILTKTCLSYEGVAFEQGVTIETYIEEPLLFKCNRDEIEQMASTLLDNAVRHSYKDTTVRVSARYIKGKNAVCIRVINTGDPIPEEDRERIFERFYRGDKARSRSGNSYGLGLAIAKRIANNHNGDIQASSKNGDTVFQTVLKK